MSQSERAVSTLHTLFIIVCLQEMAWIAAPLLISSNVFLHACIRRFSTESLIFSGVIFAFFFITGVALVVTLYVAHVKAVRKIKSSYFLPYAIVKSIRVGTMAILSFVILFSPTLIKTYFYACIYGLFESVAGAVALEVTIRCIRETKRMKSGRRRQGAKDAASLPTNVASKSTIIQEA